MTISLSHRESDEAYHGVVAVLNDRWRVIACRDGIQWILQYRVSASKTYAGARWSARSYRPDPASVDPRLCPARWRNLARRHDDPRSPAGKDRGMSAAPPEMSAVADKKKGPAKAATFPSHGSTNPRQEKVMNAQKDSTAAASRKSFMDLEGGLCDTYRLALITCEMVEDTLTMGRAEKFGDGDSAYYRFTLSHDELSNLSFMTCETQCRAGKVRDQFYSIVDAGR